MPVFIWEGKNRKNIAQKGEIEAPDESAVRLHLRRLQITPNKIKKKPKDLFENLEMFQPKVTQSEVIIFARQFSTMIDAGLPLIQCLDILHTQQENKTFKKALREIKSSVEGGSTLADALRKYPAQFDDLFVNMVAAGEIGGILDTILQRLAAYMEKTAALKAKVKGALTYPLIVIIVASVVVGIILVFVIPTFEKMFADFGKALPLPTQLVVNLSRFATGNIVYIIITIILSIFSFKKFLATSKGRILFDDAILKAPIFGPLLRKVAVAKFTRTMGTMMASGVSILDSLDIVAKTSGNKTIEKAIFSVRQGITEGRTMADPLAETGVFPSMVVQMISVGEQTGALDNMLSKIADFYDTEVDQAVENLTSMIEPLMMAFLGVVVGGLVVALYLPVFQMAGAVTG
ncbi:MAG: type II secretion system F family protein [Desulfatibacillum sp.]|nr:type II secretion system F family protein [Desulfatibacillum sp.]